MAFTKPATPTPATPTPYTKVIKWETIWQNKDWTFIYAK